MTYGLLPHGISFTGIESRVDPSKCMHMRPSTTSKEGWLNRGVQNRGVGSEVSHLRVDLDADEPVELGNACCGGE